MSFEIFPQVTMRANFQKFITEKPVCMACIDYYEESIFIKTLSLLLLQTLAH